MRGYEKERNESGLEVGTRGCEKNSPKTLEASSYLCFTTQKYFYLAKLFFTNYLLFLFYIVIFSKHTSIHLFYHLFYLNDNIFIIFYYYLIFFYCPYLLLLCRLCQDSPFHLSSFFHSHGQITFPPQVKHNHLLLLLLLPFLFSSLSHGQINSPPQEPISITSTDLKDLKKSLSVEACMVESLSYDFKRFPTIEFVF